MKGLIGIKSVYKIICPNEDMIPKERVLARTARYLSRDHPELTEDWKEVMLGLEIGLYEKRDFYALTEILERKEVYLSHNGEIEIALPFEDVVSSLGIHANPETIPIAKKDLGSGYFWEVRRCGDNFDREFKPVFSWKESCFTYVDDQNPKIFPEDLYQRFIEGLFDLQLGTFESCIVQASYGIRLDTDTPLRKLLRRCIEEKIKVFIHTADLEFNNNRVYVVNSFEI